MHGEDARRERYLHRLNSSHLQSSQVSRYVELPARLEGRTILDIGAGTSTASMDLSEKGARLVALDLRFRDVEEIRRSSVLYFKMYESSLGDPVLKRRNPMLESVYEDDRKDLTRFFGDWSDGCRGTYVAGDLWKLPFADDTFDLVYSIRCLSDCYADPDCFLEAACEALRVVKPGSSVQISPWQEDYLSLIRGLPIGASIPHQERVLLRLRAGGLAYQVKGVSNSDVRCLSLVKRAARQVSR
jgi:ubiquinone/menaquinone biosynthesis C-methylase UbiE